jgi:hypothetical protein
MVKYTHIVPVGHTPEILEESIKESIKTYPVNKLILVLGRNEDEEGEKMAREVADKVEKNLAFITSERFKTDLFDVLTAVDDLVQKTNKEKKDGSKVIFNISGSLRTIDIACYITSLLTGSDSCVGAPLYKNKKLVGLRGLCPLPIIPIIKPTAVKVSILGMLDTKNWKSLEDLADEYNQEDIKIGSKKSKISFHLKDLKEANLVETTKKDKTLTIRLTKLGSVYYNNFKSE